MKTKLAVRQLDRPRRDEKWEVRHEWGGQRVYDLVLHISGFYVKSAQIMASKGVGACLPGCLSTWMPGCLDAWMPGCLDAWMPVCLDAWMLGYVDAWMPACLDARMPGCLDAWMPAFLDAWAWGHPRRGEAGEICGGRRGCTWIFAGQRLHCRYHWRSCLIGGSFEVAESFWPHVSITCQRTH